MNQPQKMYSVPAKYRRIENLHILFWLIKDISWAMLWKPIGMVMIVPTMTAAILITWQTRHIRSEFFHNLAVIFWISANVYWMIVEFFFTDDSLRYCAIIPFSIGLVIISYYYLVARRNNVDAKTSG